MNKSLLKIHNLSNGATVTSLSPHGFKFSDGTESSSQHPDVVSSFNLERKFESVGQIAGMAVNQMRMVLSESQISDLREVADTVDVVIVPFPVLVSLRESGIRDQFPNCVSFNATKETMRSAPVDKVIDINNWSY